MVDPRPGTIVAHSSATHGPEDPNTMSHWYRQRHTDYPVGNIKTARAEPQPEPEPQSEASKLDAMTKAELLEHAQQLGVSPANNAMTKDELRAAVDAFEG